MNYRNGIVGGVALAISSVSLAALLYTDAYAHAAGSEAHGYHSLAHDVLCADPVAGAAPNALIAAVPVALR